MGQAPPGVGAVVVHLSRVSECVITYDGAPTYSLSVMEITEGLVTHETQYFADPFPASPGRAALAEAIPAHDQ